jgi:hypothetical protein
MQPESNFLFHIMPVSYKKWGTWGDICMGEEVSNFLHERTNNRKCKFLQDNSHI